jgi:hypothetical protein
MHLIANSLTLYKELVNGGKLNSRVVSSGSVESESLTEKTTVVKDWMELKSSLIINSVVQSQKVLKWANGIM